ncbi:Peptidoglycan glycosyltransferase [Alkaliphilus metalliredigens QYMF]|uniref:Peptidoglycan glycosyltransferase n=1 Tax=Alkaliphilus metalliredigens (strain QYMF) TaxID=293826 RepID=A6TR09_ALKMQ|nr:penicillin-binding transpeptidase domain-containing protein [Alkaliphilus metalliredigens]ABR48627.1 Peptidoglycan glycosyltransferase [Alkaliphilus metalliredigens QYMF]
MSRVNQKLGKIESVYIKRLWCIGLLATLCLVLLLMRLFYIQWFKHDLYTTEVNRQRSVSIALDTGRGTILDRNFIPLTGQERQAVAVIIPQVLEGNPNTLSKIEKITEINSADMLEQLSTKNQPLVIPIDVEVNWEERHGLNRMGVFIVDKEFRYKDSPMLAHVVGYTHEIDHRGLTGLEKALDEYLYSMGSKALNIIVDGKKRLLPGEGIGILKQPGLSQHVKLTIDYQVQKIIEEIMDQQNREGAIIVSNVQTGEILGMSSRPNFNPNEITAHINSQGDELYNRATQMAFPPGSIFKIVIAAEALRQNKLDFNETFFCKGFEQVGESIIRCTSYNQGGHGEIKFEDAFAKSCNSVFIQMGQRLGAGNIIEMAKQLGLNEKVGIGLEETQGNLPLGDGLLGPVIGNISIGQGEIEVTPLQINQMTQIIANSGVKKPLFIVDEIIDDQYGTIEAVKRQHAPESTVIDQEITMELQNMMAMVMAEGTGGRSNELRYDTAGKTGTAQARNRGEDQLHAWFTGYYPLNTPQYAITVLIENGGSGGAVAVPIFREILEEMLLVGY